jgi:hypothetical protein
MIRKPVLGLAGVCLAAAALTGCQNTQNKPFQPNARPGVTQTSGVGQPGTNTAINRPGMPPTYPNGQPPPGTGGSMPPSGLQPASGTGNVSPYPPTYPPLGGSGSVSNGIPGPTSFNQNPNYSRQSPGMSTGSSTPSGIGSSSGSVSGLTPDSVRGPGPGPGLGGPASPTMDPAGVSPPSRMTQSFDPSLSPSSAGGVGNPPPAPVPSFTGGPR